MAATVFSDSVQHKIESFLSETRFNAGGLQGCGFTSSRGDTIADGQTIRQKLRPVLNNTVRGTLYKVGDIGNRLDLAPEDEGQLSTPVVEGLVAGLLGVEVDALYEPGNQRLRRKGYTALARNTGLLVVFSALSYEPRDVECEALINYGYSATVLVPTSDGNMTGHYVSGDFNLAGKTWEDMPPVEHCSEHSETCKVPKEQVDSFGFGAVGGLASGVHDAILFAKVRNAYIR
jgi:hypothetical protein